MKTGRSKFAKSALGFLWVGDHPSLYDWAGIRLFELSGADVHLFTYGPINRKFLPNSIHSIDAREILPERYVFQNKTRKTFSGFSNLFRYQMLLKSDLVWLDTDMIPGPKPLAHRSIQLGWESSNYLNGAILRLPQASDMLAILIRESWQISKLGFRWGELGPKLITRVAAETANLELAQEKEVFYPVNPSTVWKLFSPRHFEWSECTVGASETIHLWNEKLRHAGKDFKNYRPPRGSYLDRIFNELGKDYLALPELHPWKMEAALRVQAPARLKVADWNERRV